MLVFYNRFLCVCATGIINLVCVNKKYTVTNIYIQERNLLHKYRILAHKGDDSFNV